jgi:L-lactate dehydrogenase complex protein LldF
MSEQEKAFLKKSEVACNNKEKKEILKKNLNHFYEKWDSGRKQFYNIELARKKLHFAKYKSIENLEKNIIEFETKFRAGGGNVFFASDKNEALKFILKIIQDNGTNRIVKSKSMVCEEIELEKFLNKNNISVLETDLGEFIVQQAKEKPSHITAPALHKSKNEIVALFNEHFGQMFDENTEPQTMVTFVRNLLREEFSKAGVGITGCNFLIAEHGAVAITENEANAVLSASFPKTHIIITSIEKIIFSFDQLELFQTMLSSHGTGQMITAYNHLVFGPSTNKEINGPEQVFVILLNNNRTSIIEDVNLREASYCIKCGACHNFCPVFRQIGGHAYQSVYNGPIGSITSPLIFGNEEYSYLPFASTLCGKCNDVCPVRINLTSLLIQKRKYIVSQKLNKSSERFVFSVLNRQLLKRKRIERRSVFIKNTALRFILRKNWAQHREIPLFAKQSFNRLKKQQAKSWKK